MGCNPYSLKNFFDFFLYHQHPLPVLFQLEGWNSLVKIIENDEEIFYQVLIRQGNDRGFFFLRPFTKIIKIRLEVFQRE